MSANVPAGNPQFQQLAQAFPFLQSLYSPGGGAPNPYGQNPFYNWYTPQRPGALTTFPQMPPQGPGNLIAPPVGAQAPTIFPQGQAPGVPPPTGPMPAGMLGMNPGQSPLPPMMQSTPLPNTAPPPPAPLFPPPSAPTSAATPPAPTTPPTATQPPGATTPLTQQSLLQLYPWMASYGNQDRGL